MARAAFLIALMLWGMALARDGVDAWVDATELPPLQVETGSEVRDRDGQLLRAYTVADGRWRLGTGLDAVDPDFIAMLIRYEDKRFYDHAGADPRAMIRAVWQAASAGQVVSGGSTLTMQTARLLEDGTTGRWAGKLRQIRLALALERKLSKDEILTLYLNRAPYGGNLEGVRAASWAWFGKPPRRLTPAEAALLIALPQSPEARRPDRDAAAATRARDRVLDRMEQAGLLDRAATGRLPVEPIRRGFPQWAAHLADRVRQADPARLHHDLTLSRDLQMALEALASQAVAGRGDKLQTAIVVADHQTGEVLASVGSASYRADGRAGFVDLTQAKRSPGSTLKPLVYALAFDRGLAHPETIIADRPMDFGGYRPQNFDGIYRGDVRVRQALQMSLNLPVVALTEAIGPHHLMAALERAGTRPKVAGDAPGLAVSLGGVGISLTDLVQLYAGLANGGAAVPLHVRESDQPATTVARITGPVPAWYVADILLQTPRPAGVQARGIAYKTGTSYGYRDAWAIGFDGRHVVGVWMGRADGTPVPGAFGGGLAAPVMFQAFARIKPSADPIAPPPAGALLVGTSGLPEPLRRFGNAVADVNAPQIAFPPDGAVLEGGALVARVSAGRPPFTWLADGTPIAQSRSRQVDLGTFEPGFAALTVIDADGASDRVRVALQ